MESSSSPSTTTTTPDLEGPPSSLPSHPARPAFFDALDEKSSAKPKKRCSDFVKKQLTSLGWRNRHSQDEYYPISVADANFSIRQIQRGEIEGTYGTGACVWPAAVVLVKYLEHHAKLDLVRNKNLVDLGSGTAVTSVAAAILGASRVICTDGSDNVVRLARENIQHAAKEIFAGDEAATEDEAATVIRGCKITTQVLWWGKDTLQGQFTSDETDVVLVADCVLPKLFPIAPLVQAIDELLLKPESFALVSYEHRYFPEYDPRDKFRELAVARGLQVEVIPHDSHHPIYKLDDVEIWKVYRQT